uniref:Ion_trans_2 domain-containing protein n=1 Tax=Heterorhabditis bacteriophora TaxID=37862 RepID=A0A1I7XLZ0_HETBA
MIQAHQVGSALRQDVRQGLKRVRKVPRWVRILTTIYHDYGLKHVCLISILIIYQFIGAGVFYFCEAGFDESKEKLWNYRIAENRTKFVGDIIPLMFNNTEYLFFLTHEQTEQVSASLHSEIARYEKQLGIRYTDQKIRWDFWNAMLYAQVLVGDLIVIYTHLLTIQTICTTIGYGHLYPSTVAGRLFTMVYAIFGIPLVLSILDDLGWKIFKKVVILLLPPPPPQLCKKHNKCTDHNFNFKLLLVLHSLQSILDIPVNISDLSLLSATIYLNEAL